MVLKELSSKCIDIVKRFPYREYGRLNSFAVVDDWAELNTENFLQTYHTGKLGYYWSRKWAASGNSEDAVCADFDLLFLHIRDSQIDVKNGCYCLNIDIGVAMPPSCRDCNEMRKRHEQYIEGSKMLMTIFNELSSVKYYKNIEIDGVMGDYLLSDSEVEMLRSSGVSIGNMAGCDDWESVFKKPTFQYSHNGSNDLSIVFTTITFCTKAENDIVLRADYDIQEIKESANTTCKFC